MASVEVNQPEIPAGIEAGKHCMTSDTDLHRLAATLQIPQQGRHLREAAALGDLASAATAAASTGNEQGFAESLVCSYSLLTLQVHVLYVFRGASAPVGYFYTSCLGNLPI
jgi:hypothetical protein